MIKQLIMALTIVVSANSYADNLTTILVGFPPGGGNYIVAQAISETATKLGYDNVIEIKAGAGGIIGMNDCAARVKDKTLICIASQAQYVYSIIPTLDDVRKFDPDTLTYIKMVGYTPNVLITSAKNTKSLSDVINDLKSNKSITFASGALGLRVVSSMLIKETGSKNAIVVDYRGVGPAIIDIMGQHTDYAFVPYATIKSQISSGFIRVIANAGGDIDELKEYPKLKTLVPNMPEDSTMFGFVAAENTEASVVESHNKMLTHILGDKHLRDSLKDIGIFLVPQTSSPAEFKEFAHKERIRFKNQLKIIPVQ